MTRNRVIFLVLSLVIVIPVVLAAYVASAADDGDNGEDSLYKYLTVFTEVLSRIRQNYVDTTDLDGLIAGALDGAPDALDAFSVYVPRDGVGRYEEARRLGLSRSGIQLVKDQGVVYVVGVQAGSPGEEAGIRFADIIAEIDGEPTRTLPLWEAQRAVSGADGKPVGLELVRLNEVVAATLTPREFALPNLSLREERGVGVLRIPSFGPQTAEDARRTLEQIAGSGKRGVIVDLRGALGGDPDAAFEVAGLFVQGSLGSLVKRDETLAAYDASTPPVWQGRVVVLIDRGTQGPAEVLASILRQALEAELVGQRTFGHAGRSASRELSNGGKIFFTDAFFTGPDGEPLNASLVPDVRIEDRFFADDDKAEAVDRALERGIELLLEEEEAVEKAA